MNSFKALFMIAVLATLAACTTGTFAPTQSSQDYQDYSSDLHMNPDVINNSHGW